MGRIRYVLFRISKLLPKQHRRPIILLSSILGLLIFFNVLLSLTASPYLQVIKSGVLDLFAPVNDTRQAVILVLLFFLVIGWSSWRYYKYLQTVISIGYVILLVLSVLPFVLGAG